MNEIFEMIPLPEAEYESEYDCGDGAYMLVFTGASGDAFRQYCARLEGSGYAVSDTSEIDGNIHATFTGELFVHTYYTPCDGKIRIIADKKIPVYTVAPVCPGNEPVVLWQFEVDHTLIDCGMCYIVRCDDGSFFVIDSAHFYSVRDDIRLIEFLRKISGEEKPRISGWFLSHAHEDHIGRFNSLLQYYSGDVSIETVYCNFPSPEHRDAPWEIQFFNTMEIFRKELVFHPEINVVKLHTGMRFSVRNLAFTVLCTHEDVFPASTGDFNNTSTVIVMECAESRVLFPGDASTESDRVMISRYNKALSCDVIQVSHHGHTGCSPEFYRRANAKCALFPVTVIKFDEEWERQESNRTAVEIADEYFIASDGTAEITLPYRPGEVKVYPDETFEDFNGIYQLWSYEYTPERKRQLYDEFLKRSGKGKA